VIDVAAARRAPHLGAASRRHRQRHTAGVSHEGASARGNDAGDVTVDPLAQGARAVGSSAGLQREHKLNLG
jgi:hypothetical protein